MAVLLLPLLRLSDNNGAGGGDGGGHIPSPLPLPLPLSIGFRGFHMITLDSEEKRRRDPSTPEEPFEFIRFHKSSIEPIGTIGFVLML